MMGGIDLVGTKNGLLQKKKGECVGRPSSKSLRERDRSNVHQTARGRLEKGGKGLGSCAYRSVAFSTGNHAHTLLRLREMKERIVLL